MILIKRIKVLFTGKVQGVYFRATTRRYANELGVTGMVKNLPDGRVELIAESEPRLLDTLLAQLDESFEITHKKIVEVTREEAYNTFFIAY